MRTCGWTPRDMGEPLRKMFDQYRNPEVLALPRVDDIELDEEERRITISFDSPISAEHMDTIRGLVEKESLQKNGVRFLAISKIEAGMDGSSVVMEMIEPSKPKLTEIKPDHYVSCLLYEEQTGLEELDEGATQSILQG